MILTLNKLECNIQPVRLRTVCRITEEKKKKKKCSCCDGEMVDMIRLLETVLEQSLLKVDRGECD